MSKGNIRNVTETSAKSRGQVGEAAVEGCSAYESDTISKHTIVVRRVRVVSQRVTPSDKMTRSCCATTNTNIVLSMY